MQDMGGLSGVEPDEGLLAPREIGSSELIVDGERVVITEAEGSHIEPVSYTHLTLPTKA